MHFDEEIVRIELWRLKTNVKLETFITPEAWREALKFSPNNWARTLEDDKTIDLNNPDTRIFGTNLNPIIDAHVWSNQFRDALKKAVSKEPDLKKKFYTVKAKKKLYSITLRTATRKYFFSHAGKKAGFENAHAWLGHKKYISIYARLPLEDRQNLFRFAIPELTIFENVEADRDKLLRDIRVNIEMLVDEPQEREQIMRESDRLSPKLSQDEILRS